MDLLQKMTFDHKIYLASQSPRRQELLAAIGWEFEVYACEVDESYPKELAAADVPVYLARKKAAGVNVDRDSVVISADTVVILNDKILGKPANPEEAREFLNRLSGNQHQVITGVCLKFQHKLTSFKEITTVAFKKLQQEEINYYIDTFNPLDKAGAYGIQEWIGMIGVTGIEGSYFNVVGLPVHRLYRELKALGSKV